MIRVTKFFATMSAILFSQMALASLIVPMHITVDGEGRGKDVGSIRLDDTIYGLLITPKLHGLPPGVHGFHVHQDAMCDHKGMAAGGHFDPDKTDAHRGPYNGQGHLGDLPVLIVAANGRATLPVLAPRLKLTNIINHALMIHVGKDNYSDVPEKLGGGGARLACGVIPYY